ncbi:SseB family protein [Solilutibacter silvestris]|nr:SseB family protein [Lysobacter silvestris]
MDEASLEALMEEARISHDAEARFFQVLLNSVVYVHAPLSDDHPRLRLLTFPHPNGFMALPFFTSLRKAQVAAGTAARILATTGRELFAGSNGATFMVNPNDGGAVIYPEEIQSLLDTGFVSRVEKSCVESERQVYVSSPADVPEWFIDALRATCTALEMIKSGFLLEVGETPNETSRGLVIILGVSPDNAERAARAIALCLQRGGKLDSFNRPLDITTFDPAGNPPEWMGADGLRFYPTLS